ncbi:MAG: hypothetical protein KAR00_01770 [Candidatus Pacebacteria bacterium]|nr:hypothetical protein [Candidatus Paceibacterota bacterium]
MSQNNKPSVVFESEEFQPSRRTFQTKTPKMVRWVINHSGGRVKDEKQANCVLLGVVVVVVATSLFLVCGGNTRQIERNINPETGKEIIPGQVPGEI